MCVCVCVCVIGRTKIFIRFPETLFETEDKFQKKKNDLG